MCNYNTVVVALPSPLLPVLYQSYNYQSSRLVVVTLHGMG